MPDHQHSFVFLSGAVSLAIALMAGCGAGGTAGTSQPLSLQALYAQCGLPADCAAPMPCDGRRVAVAAEIDPENIFDRQHYPNLPYEKFKLTDGRGRSLEVWPQAADNRLVFAKLAERPTDRIVVRGWLAAVQTPIRGRCHQGIKVLIDDPAQILF